MRHYGLRSIIIFTVMTTTCRGQVSDSCKTTIITPEVNRVVGMLQSASGLTDATAKQKGIEGARQEFSDTLVSATTFGACLGGLDEKKFAGILEIRRIDKQVGASSGGAGSTNLVPSGSVPALLGLAVEYGGLTEAFSGTTVTLRTTPAKLIGAMANLYGPDAKFSDDKTFSALQRVSLSASFDTSRTDGASTNSGSKLLANYQQLSQATMRIIFINDRDPLATKNWKKIRTLSLSPPSKNVAEEAKNLMAPLTRIKNYDAALDEAMKVFDPSGSIPTATALENAFITYLEDVQKVTTLVPDWQQRVDSYVLARLKLDEQHKKLYKQISKAPSLTFEYDFNRPPVVSATASTSTTTPSTPSVSPPDLSAVSLVFVASMLESEYTLNATGNFFNETRPGMSGNFRDFQVSGKWDIPIGRVPAFVAKGTLTFGGLFEHLHQKPLGADLLINDQKVNQPGNMGVFQAKYSIPVGDSGIQIPISFTASNRTELIKERDMRGNIGITFDLDKLLTKK
jgi:hypothetical protein